MMKHLLVLLVTGACLAEGAWARSSCSSDGQLAPITLVERFISADCEACWSAPQATHPKGRAITIDWIVPSGQGDDASLSAAATRDAQMRLEALARTAPGTLMLVTTKVQRHRDSHLRVAHGVPIGDYIGAIIEWRTNTIAKPREPLSAWLLLVETIAAGAEGTPVERNLVRNVLVLTWDKPDKRSDTGQYLFQELRPLNIEQGAKAQHLRVLGWVQNAQGQLLTAAQSVCETAIQKR